MANEAMFEWGSTGTPEIGPPGEAEDVEAAASGEGQDQVEGPARKRRRRGSRGGRNRRKKPATSEDGEQLEASPEPVALLPADVPPPPKPRIGDTRPAPAPIKQEVPSAEAAGRAAPEAAVASGSETSGGRRRRKGGRGRPAAAARNPVEAVLVDEPVELDEETLERRRGRERKGRPVGRYLMVVHSRPGVTQIAVLEGRTLIEHYVSRPADDATQIDGNIYLGRVQNVLPGMEAAFIDIGTPKNAVLYRGDVRYEKDDLELPGGDAAPPSRGKLSGGAQEARIEQLLKTGQTIVCQVTKNPIGTKGARLSQEVSLPGRFVVLIPNSDTYGISKRLADDERKRLRRILDEVRPAGHGLIVRTAAEGATADELRRDVARLTQQWERIDQLATTSRAPALLYREPDMAVRVIREEFNRDYRGVVIDDQSLYEEVRDYVASINPELADRVEWAGDSDDPLPVFERYHVHEQIHKALDRKVWLPSGGSLIIERTEALTVIDVNTGKNVGTSNLEETVFRNNLEAAEEIAHQLRLRDIGGIIVIDFIDMEIAANRAEVIKTFRGALARDKTRSQVFDISELGLVEMTRKRISEGLVESFSETCPTCGGRGIVFDESLL
jgi:ribonuclease E